MAKVPLEGKMSVDVGTAGAGSVAMRVAFAKKYAAEAIRLADKVCELERKFVDNELDFSDVQHRHEMSSIQTVMMAVASIEAGVKEFLADVRTKNPLYREGISKEMCDKMDAEKRVEDVNAGREAKVIARAQTICKRLAGNRMDPKIVKAMRHLIYLRNELTHSDTSNQPYVDASVPAAAGSYEARLGSLFKHSGLARPDAPFFPVRCLGAGCAQWAVETAYAFSKEFQRVTGFSLGFMKPAFPGKGAPKK